MNGPKYIPLQGWTLSETLVMMIVAGIVFLAVMDGIVLFNRYTQLKTEQITANMRLYEGYYHLQYLTAAADSVSAEDSSVRLYRESAVIADLYEKDSVLIVRMGHVTDTLMYRVSGLALAENTPLAEADSVKLAVGEPGGNRLELSFPIKPPVSRTIIPNLREQEKQYAYE